MSTRYRGVPPATVYDTPCRHAAPELFDPLPSAQSLGSREKRADRARAISYAARYCNGTDTRPTCRYRQECLLWALEARQRCVAGGVEVTLAMIDRHHRAKREASLAAEEATASSDRPRELAER